ncbi:MAG: transcriptional regulator GcvA [Endozoicomonas sp.]
MARFPSLKGLQYFEVVARHLSFTRAAKELHVTQAAVSQQIRNLEQELGSRLFRRTTRRLLLSDDGERLLPHVRQAFSSLESGLRKIRNRHYDYLNISVLPSFAARWLVPRLGRFAIQHPDIEIRLLPSLDLVDFSRGDIDLAIRFGEGVYPGLKSTLLMEESVFPVCSPGLATGEKSLLDVEDLRHFPLLQDAGPGALTWREWLKIAGHSDLDVRYGIQITDASLLIDAARSGQGVALSRASLVKDEIERGQLVKPFATELDSVYSYYLVMPDREEINPRMKLFCEWIQAECQNY